MGRWIVNAAWPYVNSVPHLGTFIHLLCADVYARYLRLKGEDLIAVTGSDEHGTPIEVEAIQKGLEPKELTDEYHKRICELLDAYDIHFDNYTRTESPIHVKFARGFYARLYEKGYVFSKTIEMPFCEFDERFLPDRFIEGTCPHCGFEQARGDQCDACGRVLDPLQLISQRCAFCGKRPIIKSTQHWFFDIPRFREKLREYIKANARLPDNARNFCLRWLEEGLEPRSLTRDNKWGIPAPFPGSDGKTLYVWMEAVLGYVSASVEWAEKSGRPDAWKSYWLDKDTRNVHFIGKDNIPFHLIILPALFMAAEDGYVLPWQVSSSEFVLYEGQKFSKSRRIGVWMDETLKIAPAEYWRYVLIAMRPETRDSNFTWNEFQQRVNGELNDVLGNFVHRTLSFIVTHFDAQVPEPSTLNDGDRKVLDSIQAGPTKIASHMDNFQLRASLSAVIDLARTGNQYLSESEPWHQIRKDRVRAATVLYVVVQLVHALGILNSPFLPATAKKIREQLALGDSEAAYSWWDAGKIMLKPGHRLGKPEPLFRKITGSFT